jgi:hypothetical protein
LVLRASTAAGRAGLAVECKNTESVELHFVIMLSGMQRPEIGDPVDAEHHGWSLSAPIAPIALDDPKIG